MIIFKKTIILISTIFLCGLSACDNDTLWDDGEYKVYWIDDPRNIKLGIMLESGGTIERAQYVSAIGTNQQYITVLSCENIPCQYYYIDRINDQVFSGSREFVYGPFNKAVFYEINTQKNLPMPVIVFK